MGPYRKSRLSTVVGAVLVAIVLLDHDWSEAESVQRVGRAELASRLEEALAQAGSSIHVAVTDCTFALMSRRLRTVALQPSLRGRVVVRMEQTGTCLIPGYEPAPPPYNFDVLPLQPIRIDEERKLAHRRELLVIDRVRIFVILSDTRFQKAEEFHLYIADVPNDAAARQLVSQFGAVLWPASFPAPPAGVELRRDPRWSPANHRRLTDSVLGNLGFSRTAIAAVKEGNVHVDRLANQFNNPQHSIRNLGQSLEAAKREAEEWIGSCRANGLKLLRAGETCCALFAFGEGIHTIQDRKHGWIFLFQHLLKETISDYWKTVEPEEWQKAEDETRAFAVAFIGEVAATSGDETVRGFKTGSEYRCTCDGVTVEGRP